FASSPSEDCADDERERQAGNPHPFALPIASLLEAQALSHRERVAYAFAPYLSRPSTSVIALIGASKSLPAFHFSKAMTLSMRRATKASAASRPSNQRMVRAGIRMPPRIARLE